MEEKKKEGNTKKLKLKNGRVEEEKGEEEGKDEEKEEEDEKVKE